MVVPTPNNGKLTVLMVEQRGDRDRAFPLTKNMIQLFNFIEEATKPRLRSSAILGGASLHNAENGEGFGL